MECDEISEAHGEDPDPSLKCLLRLSVWKASLSPFLIPRKKYFSTLPRNKTYVIRVILTVLTWNNIFLEGLALVSGLMSAWGLGSIVHNIIDNLYRHCNKFRVIFLFLKRFFLYKVLCGSGIFQEGKINHFYLIFRTVQWLCLLILNFAIDGHFIKCVMH
jgi:hypothetical protein